MIDPQTAKANEAALTVLRSSEFQAMANTLPIPGLAEPRRIPGHITGPPTRAQRGSAGEAVGHRETYTPESRTGHFQNAANQARGL
jgi:hypothetical protein